MNAKPVRFPAFLLLVLALARNAGADEEPSCVTHCHGGAKVAFGQSVHAGLLACVDCHGGNPEAQRDEERSHDPAAGFTGRVPRERIPELCGGCHSDPQRMHFHGLPTDQLANYRTSNHGAALFERGDTRVAVCTDCHGAHDVLHAGDPRARTAPANQPATCGACHSDPAHMQPYGLPADTVARFADSDHARALAEGARGAPSCSACHGAHGASPPGVRDVGQVCGACHANTGAFYRQSPHAASQEMNCTTCHGAHDIPTPGEWMYEGDGPGHCGECHDAQDDAQALIRTLQTGKAALRAAMRTTQDELRVAKTRGLFLENEDVYLRESQRVLVSIQPLSHSLDRAVIAKHLEDGRKRQDRTIETLAKKRTVLRDRKLLLSGVTLLLLLLTGLLAVKLEAVRRLS